MYDADQISNLSLEALPGRHSIDWRRGCTLLGRAVLGATMPRFRVVANGRCYRIQRAYRIWRWTIWWTMSGYRDDGWLEAWEYDTIKEANRAIDEELTRIKQSKSVWEVQP